MNVKELQERIDSNMKELETLKANAEKEVRHLTPEEMKQFNSLMGEVEKDAESLETEKRFASAKNRMSKPIESPTFDTTAPKTNTEFRTLGEFLRAVVSAEDRNSLPDPRLKRAATGMSEAVPADGGFLVIPKYSETILKNVWESANFAGRAARIPIATNSIKLPYLRETSRADGSRWGGIRAYWMAEAGQFTSSKPAVNEITMNPHKVGCLVYLTEELMNDYPAMEAFVSQTVGQELAFAVDAAIVSGDGAGKPKGILPTVKASNAGVCLSATRGTASTIVANDIATMMSYLPEGSMNRAVWFANQSTLPKLAQLSAGDGLIWMPNWQVGAPSSLMGRPLIFTEQVSKLGTMGDLNLFDMSQYLLVDRQGVVGASSIHVRFLYDEMALRFTMRVDGQCWWESAVTCYDGTNKVSPFVTLGTVA